MMVWVFKINFCRELQVVMYYDKYGKYFYDIS